MANYKYSNGLKVKTTLAVLAGSNAFLLSGELATYLNGRYEYL